MFNVLDTLRHLADGDGGGLKARGGGDAHGDIARCLVEAPVGGRLAVDGGRCWLMAHAEEHHLIGARRGLALEAAHDSPDSELTAIGHGGALLKIDVEGVKIKIIRSGIGAITDSDVVLANASNAIIIGFNVATNSHIKDLAKEYNVDIKLYTIIYKLVEDIEGAMKGMRDPEFEEKVIGNAEVRALFKFSKVGTIAGTKVTKGVIKNGSKVRIIRDSVIIYDGIIGSVQREKDSVKEVKEGFECGITVDGYNDLKVGDILETYEDVEVKK